MIQRTGGSSHIKKIKNKDYHSSSWSASPEGMVEPVKAENTDCGLTEHVLNHGSGFIMTLEHPLDTEISLSK